MWIGVGVQPVELRLDRECVDKCILNICSQCMYDTLFQCAVLAWICVLYRNLERQERVPSLVDLSKIYSLFRRQLEQSLF